MMRTILLTLAGLCLGLLPAVALPIDADEARAIAENFLKSRNGATLSAAATVLNNAASGEGGASCCYLFNADGRRGWVIVAGDDGVENPILGFNLTGSLQPDIVGEPIKTVLRNMPTAMAMLPKVDVKAGTAMKAGARRAATKQRSSILPMIDTEWGQRHGGYNLWLPTVGTASAPAGCVAVAMGKVMYQHQYPRELPYAIPAKSMSGKNAWAGKTFDFPEREAGTKIDWDNILPAYTYRDEANATQVLETTDDQKQAIAALMAYCGQAVGMTYSPTGSGAYNTNIPSAMAYFGYPSVYSMNKNTFNVKNTTEGIAYWEDLVHWELSEGRSVIYGGTSTVSTGSADASHSFVIDGYDGETGNFHVHWGWYGYPNGYFNLSLLNPTAASGTEYQFSTSQTLTMGLAPVVRLATATTCVLTDKKVNIVAKSLIDNENLELVCGVGTLGTDGKLTAYLPVTTGINTLGATESMTIDMSVFSNYTVFKNLSVGTEVKMYPVCYAKIKRNSTVSSSSSTASMQCIGNTLMGDAFCTITKTSSGLVFAAIEATVGDVNKDGEVSIADVTALVNILLGKDSVEPYRYDHVAADVNKDGVITIADVTKLINMILGKE